MSLIFIPPKLQDLAFYIALKEIWQKSKLPTLLPNINDRNQVREEEYLSRSDVEYQIGLIVSQSAITTKLPKPVVDDIDRNQEREQEYIWKTDAAHKIELALLQAKIMKMKLPSYWLMKLAVGLQGLDKEINEFVDELVSNLLDGKGDNIITCCTNFAFDDLSYINKKQTILNIMYDSAFNVFFHSSFFGHNCISPEDLNEISEQLKGNKKLTTEEFKMNKNVKTVIPVLKYWLLQYFKVQGKTPFPPSLFQFIMASNSEIAVKSVNFFENQITDTDVEIALKYIIYKKRCLPHVVILLFENVPEDTWLRILERNFVDIFHILIVSWRHRHHLASFYKQVVNKSLTLTDFKAILNRCYECYSQGYYEFSDIMSNIVLKIWNITPLNYVKDPDVAYNILPKLVNVFNDFKSFAAMLCVYKDKMRRQVYFQTILHLVGLGKKEWVNVYFVELGLSGNPLDNEFILSKYFTEEDFKTFIIYSKSLKNNERMIYYERVITYCSDLECNAKRSIENEIIFRENLLSDDNFILEFCKKSGNGSICACTEIEDLLFWCYNDDTTKRKLLNERLVKEKLIHRIYESYLLDVDQVLKNGKICLKLFNLPNINDIIEEITENLDIRNKIFKSLLNDKSYELLALYKTDVFRNIAQTVQWIEDFLMSDEGLKSVIDFVTYLDNIEEELSLGYSFCCLLEKYYSFRNIWLESNDNLLRQRMDRILIAYGHPNLRNMKYKLKQCYSVGDNEMKIARRYVDVNYRLFRAIVRTAVSIHSLLNRYRWVENVTDASIDLASWALLRVAVVL